VTKLSFAVRVPDSLHGPVSVEPAAHFKPDPLHLRIEALAITDPHVAGRFAADGEDAGRPPSS